MENFVRQRGGVKTSLTNFSKYVNDLKTKNELTGIEIVELESRVNATECNMLQKFCDIQDQIEVVCPEIELDKQYNERANFENSYYAVLAIAKKILNDNKAVNEAVRQSDIESRISSSRVSNVDGAAVLGVKLPTINLPTFNGSLQNWLEFRDIYESLIHNNDQISDIQRFHYLRASLSQEPAQLIKGIEFSAANYQSAWDQLKERYNNDKMLVQNHIKNIFTIEPMHKESSKNIHLLIDNLTKNMRALEQLELPVNSWDVPIVYLIGTKLDNVTAREWETFKSKNKEIASLNDLKCFLRERAEVLETLEQSRNEKSADKRNVNKRFETRGLVATGGDEKVPKCVFCKGQHYIQTCSEFLNIPVSKRAETIMSMKLCLNCLRAGHFNRSCRRPTCKKCYSKHHVLLHQDKMVTDNNNDVSQAGTSNSSVILEQSTVNSACSDISNVLLSTVCVVIYDKFKNGHVVRALLDTGSQSSFITEDICNRLGLPKEKVNLSINGINNFQSSVTHKCNVHVCSKYNNFSTKVTCFVLPKITNLLPNCVLNISHLNIPKDIELADPHFDKPQGVDMLIGSDLFWNIIGQGQISLGSNLPRLYNTRFGWVISGPLGDSTNRSIVCNFNRTAELDIQRDLRQFWEVEDCAPALTMLSEEEVSCENHFVENVSRDTNGSFIVKLPFKQTPSKLGESYEQAKRRFLNLEKKLDFNPKYKELYSNFMREYILLGHMTKITDINRASICYYMCHHGVYRENSLSTVLRVVFDASTPSSTGYSLNNLQMVGATIQQDLFSILVRFRRHKFVIAADIAKMYRCVLISPEDRPLQRILWRFDSNGPLETYELNTVTYGTAAASFLAIRCLFQLADENHGTYPDIAEIIKTDFYVDDLLTGADTIDDARRISKLVFEVLRQGCFYLRKFYSNEPEILNWVPNEDELSKIVEFGERGTAKTLGLIWNPKSDKLTYEVKDLTDSDETTKRTILAGSSKVFDPLGLVSPCIIKIKILLQMLWLENLSWDDPLPPHIVSQWNEFKSDMKILNTLQIQRHVFCDQTVGFELHIFSDASERAYGACVYVKSWSVSGQSSVLLLAAKSKVAPLKTITVPRLELCGALAAARLADKITKALKINNIKRFFWTDSTIVLGWLKSMPSKLKIFVANRVVEIQNLTECDVWKHVSSECNPADLLSRGMRPSEILNAEMWWHGPEWLEWNENYWPEQPKQIKDSLPDVKKGRQTFLVTGVEKCMLFERYSDFVVLNRVVAHMLRFMSNCKIKLEERQLGPLSLNEIDSALIKLLRSAQNESFHMEILQIRSGKLSSKSNLINLNPFVDADGMLRVGGRLSNAKYNFEKKHPLILSKSHPLTNLLARHYHYKLLHAGPQHLLASLREKYWIVNSSSFVKRIVKDCVTCFRFSPKITNPIMGNLPEQRLKPTHPFDVVGVDYAGPFLIKNKAGRGAQVVKGYVALFVCFLTKAVHLELVTDLSKDSFILALRRFIARRGKPTSIFSDNGTNFVAASSELKELGEFISKSGFNLVSYFAKEGMNWNFIPPRSPHFGGLWEAGIKSMKHHLKRVAGNVTFTFEIFYTLLAEIEAILNSRPITPLSSSPHDLSPLTPSHFLLGFQSSSIFDVDMKAVPVNRLTVYKHLQQIKQHIWERWSKEYVSELQQRCKWKKTRDELKEGVLVLLKEDNLPPLSWRLGRVVSLHRGSDGVPRVATVKTQNGLVKRSFAKLCPLPIDMRDENTSS